jgi:hypothetical protein
MSLGIPLSPLPSWRSLFYFFLNLNSDLISRSHFDGIRSDKILWMSRSSWSMLLIAEWRKLFTNCPDVIIWVPNYFCDSTLDQLRENGCQLVFYPISEQLKPNYELFEAIAYQHPPDIFIATHFFGEVFDLSDAEVFCSRKGAWLVEDAAHVLFPNAEVGKHSDFVLYSLHKHFPIPDGAILAIMSNATSKTKEIIDAIEAKSKKYEALISRSGSNNWYACKWLIKRMLQKIGIRATYPMPNFDASAHIKSKTTALHPKMSLMSRAMVFHAIPESKLIKQIRINHQKNWQKVIKWANLSNSISPYEIKGVPYLACFHGNSIPEVRKLFNKLCQMGLVTVAWPDLPIEVLNNPNANIVPINLRHKRLFLPIHQSLRDADLVNIGIQLRNIDLIGWSVILITEVAQWELFYRDCKRVSFLQSWAYGESKREAEGWRPYRFLISNSNSEYVAIVQVLVKQIPIFGGIARINRGPAFFKNVEHPQKMAAIEMIVKECRKRKWRLLRIAPEIAEDDDSHKELCYMGFKHLQITPFGSGFLDLRLDQNTLLMSLHSKWRNQMRKGEKLGVRVDELNVNNENVLNLITHYLDHQKDRGYKGISEKLIFLMSKQNQSNWSFKIFGAYHPLLSEKYIGHLLVISSGDTCTYVIGTTNEVGRKMQANSVLIWHAIKTAKCSGNSFFDVGGLNSDTPHGVSEFKNGLNPVPYTLIGEWRKWIY